MQSTAEDYQADGRRSARQIISALSNIKSLQDDCTSHMASDAVFDGGYQSSSD